MIVRESELMHYGVLGMKWGHRKSNYGENGSKRTEKLLKKLTDYDKKISSSHSVSTKQLKKHDKLYDKYDKSAAKDIKRMEKQGNTKAAKTISAGRTLVRMATHSNELSNAINSVAVKAKVKTGSDFTYSVLRDNEYGGVKITVNGETGHYEYLGEKKQK